MSISSGPNQTKILAESFLEKLKPGNSAEVVCLRGNLGAGKTTFVQFAAKALGIKKSITSPTFVILKTYPIRGNPSFKKLVHIDAYRLKSGEELQSLGWQEIIKDPQNLIFIEWPENVSEAIPPKTVIIEFKVLKESKREIKTKWPREKKKTKKATAKNQVKKKG